MGQKVDMTSRTVDVNSDTLLFLPTICHIIFSKRILYSVFVTFTSLAKASGHISTNPEEGEMHLYEQL